MRLVPLALMVFLAVGSTAFAQAKPRPEPAASSPSSEIEVGGFAMLGLMNFTAADTFDVALGSPNGTILGGGVRVGVPLGGLFASLGAWRFRDGGQRAFVFNGQKFSLGIPLDVTITPIEISGGWQFSFRRLPQFHPYVMGGFTSYAYTETSEFATGDENVDERFNGYHVAGGVEFPIERWLGIAWEVNWTSVPDAIGDAGLSAEFDERNLGGTSFRFKVTIGR